MARNEDGEFELMLGNKQLLSVFFLMVLLLCLCFVGGYLLGRSAAPVLTAVNEPPTQAATTAAVSQPVSKAEPAKLVEASKPAQPEPVASTAPPTRTAPQVSEKTPEPVKEKEPAPKQAAKAAPPKATPTKATPPPTKQAATAKQAPAPAAKQGPASSQPVPGRIYLQISATDKDKADVMVDLLRRKNFVGIAAPVAERPGLFRVLVGPLAETALTGTKAQLKASGFPADEAIRRVF